MFNGLSGVDSLFDTQGATFSTIPLDMIDVKKQVREVFEDEDNSLADLAENIKTNGVLQPILLRPTDDGYELIAGERRLRAAKIAGLDVIPAYIREMSDDEAENAQFYENIHRKNLTQIEEAKKLQRDLDSLGGDKQAVCELHQKSYSWVSKRLSLLALEKPAVRLISEGISADIEAILMTNRVAKDDPEAANNLVDKLKKTGGKNAREEAAEVRATVKPPKQPKVKESAPIVPTEDNESPQENQDEFFDAAAFEQENHISVDSAEQEETNSSDGFNVDDVSKRMADDRHKTLIKERESLKRDKARIEARLVDIEDEIQNISSRL
jgi:ParB family transcriptional regulator, chromosome partitioning protein